jgi:CubicO group peptidase (beta-lactamase class C family)
MTRRRCGSGAHGTRPPGAATGGHATPETLYSICSISKLFTAIAVMQLRDEGLVALSDPVAATCPGSGSGRRTPARRR